MPRHSHLREDGTQANDRVSAIELFFDLVFVFAVTQLSHYLLEHHNVAGALQTLLDVPRSVVGLDLHGVGDELARPDHAPVRLVLIAVMLLSLVLSSAIPGAFGDYGLRFALAYVAIQVGRTTYTSWAKGEWQRRGSKNMIKATVYFVAVGCAVDYRRARERSATAARVVVGGADRRIFRTACFFRAAWPRPLDGRGMGHQRRAYGRALLAVHHHLAWRGHIGHRRDVRRPGNLAPGDPRLRQRLRRLGRDVVDLLRRGRAAWQRTHRARGACRPDRREQPTPTPISRSSRASSCSPSRTNKCSCIRPAKRALPVATILGGALLFIGGNMLFKRLTSPIHRFPLSHLVGLGMFALLATLGMGGPPLAARTARRRDRAVHRNCGLGMGLVPRRLDRTLGAPRKSEARIACFLLIKGRLP